MALISSAVLVLAAFAPWYDTILSEQLGIKGDGQVTAGLGAIAALVIFQSAPRSRWLLAASALGILAGLIAAIDLIHVEATEQTLFGEPVKLVSASWGLWLTFLASVALAVGAFVSRSEALVEARDLP